ncbi:uncharacterized protein TNCV_3087441 [Trichonephila clavipes]|uniref:Transposase n=1 Tax=Trichonephila clavipes TaxID=2585209 RepID=A0A8X6RQA7_TRICX|nr:uncharacterized protein TNCV_3087441 [Trichonephila clavipes]
MITNFFIPELNNHNVQDLWIQQDGATCHTARATIDLLKDTLGDRLISRFGPVNWPPRSCDLTPLDYFLWGYVKKNAALSTQELELFYSPNEFSEFKILKMEAKDENKIQQEDLSGIDAYEEKRKQSITIIKIDIRFEDLQNFPKL